MTKYFLQQNSMNLYKKACLFFRMMYVYHIHIITYFFVHLVKQKKKKAFKEVMYNFSPFF